MHEHVERRGSSSGRWPTTWVALCALAAMALLFFWQQHSAHIVGVIPYLLLLACPVVHFFMHRGHGTH
jgi:hypothetical protein